MAFLAYVHLALFLALSLSPGNFLVSSWYDDSMLYIACFDGVCVLLYIIYRQVRGQGSAVWREPGLAGVLVPRQERVRRNDVRHCQRELPQNVRTLRSVSSALLCINLSNFRHCYHYRKVLEHFHLFFLPCRHHIQCTMTLIVELYALLGERGGRIRLLLLLMTEAGRSAIDEDAAKLDNAELEFLIGALQKND